MPRRRITGYWQELSCGKIPLAQKLHIAPSNPTCVCCRHMGKCKPTAFKNIPLNSDSCSSIALATSNNIPHVSIKIFPQFSPQSLFLALQADLSKPIFIFPSFPSSQLPPQKYPKWLQLESLSFIPGMSQTAPYLDCGGRGCNLNHLGQEIFGKWELCQGTNGSVVICHFNGTPSSARWKIGTVDIQISAPCSDLPHFMSPTEVLKLSS